MKKIRAAIIGCGYIGDYHARGLMALEGAELAVAVDTNPETAQHFAEKYRIGEIRTDAMDLGDRDDIQAVVLSVPNAYHAPYALEFLRKGKDVFLEKPMAMNVAEGEAIIATARETGQLVMVGHMWRFDREVDHIREVVRSGKLGKIIKTKGYGIHENWGPSGWFTQKKLSGGGALADMGVHAIDTVRHLLGDPQPVSVYAEIGTHYGEYDVDDSGITVISWDNGTTSVIESGWWQPHMDGPEAATRLYGTNGYGSVFPTFIQLREQEKQDYKLPGPPKSEHCDQSIYTRQMEYFLDCIRTRRSPSPGLEEGQTVLRIVDAAYASSEKKQVIFL